MIQGLSKIWQLLPLWLQRLITWLAHPTFTVGVSAVVLNERNEILFLRHWFRESSRWQLPGGIIGRNESLEDALRRELREETGYEVEVLSLVSARADNPRHVSMLYLARVLRGILNVDRKEIAEARFFARDELPSDLSEDQLRNVSLALARS
jgi:ADP-ribose pyrophosphatase YjhB (NUDIX family)